MPVRVSRQLQDARALTDRVAARLGAFDASRRVRAHAASSHYHQTFAAPLQAAIGVAMRPDPYAEFLRRKHTALATMETVPIATDRDPPPVPAVVVRHALRDPIERRAALRRREAKVERTLAQELGMPVKERRKGDRKTLEWTAIRARQETRFFDAGETPRRGKKSFGAAENA
jgi:hypothetical protein